MDQYIYHALCLYQIVDPDQEYSFGLIAGNSSQFPAFPTGDYPTAIDKPTIRDSETMQSSSSSNYNSYRQALAAVLQRYNMTGTYTVGHLGPDHATTWYCTFKINEQVVGASQGASTKVAAKEEAAHGTLTYLASNGFDVS